MKYSAFAAAAALAIGLSSVAQAQVLDRTDSPSDIQIERRANLSASSGTAVGTSGAFTVGESVWDPANDPRDVREAQRANSFTASAPADFEYRDSVWQPDR